MTSSGDGTAGFDARLRLISILLYAVGISMVLVIANTPLAQDDSEKVSRAALNLIAGWE